MQQQANPELPVAYFANGHIMHGRSFNLDFNVLERKAISP
jgi:hypothetical protein